MPGLSLRRLTDRSQNSLLYAFVDSALSAKHVLSLQYQWVFTSQFKSHHLWEACVNTLDWLSNNFSAVVTVR